MALFQKSVVKKYLNDLDKDHLKKSWQLFKSHFHNPAIQENIRDAKEEEYQEGFVRDLFVNVLGYTLKPQPNYNFVLEKKTETDATKSDGALLRDDNLIGVVELKDTGTTELDKIEKQVFGYKHKHKNCIYVITSNFEKLRFYINDSVNSEEFNLFTLTEDRFAVLYLCLHQQSIQNDIPLKMKQASVSEEENVTKKLYTDYSILKQQLFSNITELNHQYDKLELFKKTQKLLDRFLFILFAEDRLLLPPNSVREILKQWEQLKELDNYVPLYDRYKLYFGYLNTGHQGKQHEIFAYNGGLFAADEVLDNIKIDDTVLYNGTKTLSSYDFESEVDVNILGHIFEHSLSQIEEMQAELEGKLVEKTKTKRKKDGIFYTPRYITKYIVENTVGALCEQKKEELSINEEVFAYRKTKKTREPLLRKLEAYRNWLMQLTICDPACGSGAFLNQALEYLIAEHRYIDELKAKLFGDAFVLTDIENEILEHNLFGVDINEEAVEIARLSLWLRSAKKGRKLSNLSNNIKCGNSLIDDPAVAGDKAFNWQKEFPQVFGPYKEPVVKKQQLQSAPKQDIEEIIQESFETAENDNELSQVELRTRERIVNTDFSITNDDHGIVNEPEALYGNKKDMNRGFDVVIGNPPYGAEVSNDEKKYYNTSYLTTLVNYDTYGLFFEKSIQILKSHGYLGFITPNTFLVLENGEKLRSLLFKKNRIINFLEIFNVFDDAVVEPISTIIKKETPDNKNVLTSILLPRGEKAHKSDILNFEKLVFKQPDLYERNDLIFNYRASDENRVLSKKVEKDSVQLKSFAKITAGVKPYEKGKGIPPQTKEIVDGKPYTGFNKIGDEWKKLIRGTQVKKFSLEWDKEYIKYGEWLAAPRNPDSFFKPKIFIRRTDDKILAVYDEEGFIGLNSIHCLQLISDNVNLKYILSLLSSSLINWFFQFQNFHMVGKPLAEVKVVFVERLPIKIASNQLPFIAKTDIMLAKNKELHQVKQQLQKLLLSKYEELKLSKKLEDWPSLSFKEFLKELSKQKIKLSLAEENEWMNYFEEQKAKANAIQKTITETDKEIDRMVYQLYGLTEEEIKIVEGD